MTPDIKSETCTTSHEQRQRDYFDAAFAHGSREHTRSTDPVTQYLVQWRLKKAVTRLMHIDQRVTLRSSVLVMCAAEGYEGSILADLGFNDVTVSDLSPVATVRAAERDPRLKSAVLNAERAEIPDESFDVVIVQDGLHHLKRPTVGFTEMLRLARNAALFLEPHRSLAGRLLGREWEQNGTAENFVFRWDRPLVGAVASSYLGRGRFENHSFSFWHHNVVLEKTVRRISNRRVARAILAAGKGLADALASRAGNQFCGLVIKRPT